MGLFSPPILIHTIVNILTSDYRQSSCTNDVSNKIIVSINYTGCPTILETVNLELKFSLMVGVMVLKFSGLLGIYIGFNVHLLKIGWSQGLKRNSFFFDVTSQKKISTLISLSSFIAEA